MAKPTQATAPHDAPHTLVVKCLTDSEVEVLDIITRRRRNELLPSGATASRNSVIVPILRAAIGNERNRMSRARP